MPFRRRRALLRATRSIPAELLASGAAPVGCTAADCVPTLRPSSIKSKAGYRSPSRLVFTLPGRKKLYNDDDDDDDDDDNDDEDITLLT